MFKRHKIPCYVLVFDQIDIIKQSLNFLVEYSEMLDIVVVENPSENTPEIKNYITMLGEKKLIRRYYLLTKNITGNALYVALVQEREYVRNSPYILMTDGDVICSSRGWLTEEIKILNRHPNVFACGTTLSTDNLPTKTFPEAIGWVPKDIAKHRGYIEALTGIHLLLLRGRDFIDFMDWRDCHNEYFVDGILHKYCYEVLGKKWVRTKNTEARHLTWDLYSDLDHPYTRLKTRKSFRDTWYHKNVSDFTLRDFG